MRPDFKELAETGIKQKKRQRCKISKNKNTNRKQFQNMLDIEQKKSIQTK